MKWKTIQCIISEESGTRYKVFIWKKQLIFYFYFNNIFRILHTKDEYRGIPKALFLYSLIYFYTCIFFPVFPFIFCINLFLLINFTFSRQRGPFKRLRKLLRVENLLGKCSTWIFHLNKNSRTEFSLRQIIASSRIHK